MISVVAAESVSAPLPTSCKNSADGFGAFVHRGTKSPDLVGAGDCNVSGEVLRSETFQHLSTPGDTRGDDAGEDNADKNAERNDYQGCNHFYPGGSAAGLSGIVRILHSGSRIQLEIIAQEVGNSRKEGDRRFG